MNFNKIGEEIFRFLIPLILTMFQRDYICNSNISMSQITAQYTVDCRQTGRQPYYICINISEFWNRTSFNETGPALTESN